MKIKKYQPLNEAEEEKKKPAAKKAAPKKTAEPKAKEEKAPEPVPEKQLAGSPNPQDADQKKLDDLYDIDWFVNWDWDGGDNTIIPILNNHLFASLGVHTDMRFTGKKPAAYPNVGLVSQPGVGKTAKVRKWAKANNVHLYTLQASSIDATDAGGVPVIEYETIEDASGNKKETPKRMIKVSSGLMDQLNRPRSVLFLDEINRAEGLVRDALLLLVNEHIVQDPAVNGGMRFLPNFLFTVCCTNPIDGDRPGDYDPNNDAFRNRLGKYDVPFDQADDMNYYTRTMDDRINRFDNIDLDNLQLMDVELGDDAERNWIQRSPEEIKRDFGPARERWVNRDKGNRAIVNKLLSDPNFHYTSDADRQELGSDPDWNGQMTSPRSLEQLMLVTDGTKDDFINKWSNFCDNTQLPTIKSILSTYTDVVDKANSVFNRTSRSELFKTYKRQPTVDLRKKYGRRE